MLVLLALQLLGGIVSSPQRTFFPLYLKELGYSTLFISWMATAQRLTGLVAAAVGGSLSDTLGRERTLLLGQFGIGLAGLVFFTPSPWLIAGLCALSGIGLSFQTLGGQGYLLDNARPEALGVLTALYNWGYTLGGALGGPLAGLVLAASQGYTLFAATLSVLALVSVALNLALLPPSQFHAHRKSRTTLRKAGYRDIATRPTALLLGALRLLPTFYWGMALILIPLMLDAAGASVTLIAWYATVSLVGASLAQIVFGRAADRLGCKGPALLAYGLLAASVLGTALLPDRAWSIFAFGATGAAAAWGLSTLMPCMVAQVTPPPERGRMLGWIHLWWNVGMVLGSLVGGALYERSAGLPFGLAGVGIVVAMALAVVFFSQADRVAAHSA